MSSKQLITEISRIKEMMNITESKILLKENIVDELVAFLTKFLRKDVADLTALGVRNVGDVKRLMDDFLDPAISSANKVDFLKRIVDELGETALKSIAKDSVDDVTTGVGKLVNDRSTQYINYYKQGVMTYDEVITQIGNDLTSLMSKSSGELSNLKKAINDESLLKVKNQLDNAKVSLDAEIDAAAAANRQSQTNLDMSQRLSDQLDSIKTQIEALPSYKKLSFDEQSAVRNFIELNKHKNPTVLLSETGDFITRLLTDPSRVKQIPLEDRSFLKTTLAILSSPKKIALFAASGTLLVFLGLLATGNIGAARGVYNENSKSWEENDPDNPAVVPKDEKCDQDLSSFKANLKGQGFTVNTIKSATFNSETCTGSITLGDGTIGNLTWDGTTFK
jgi:hypothetical protein